MSEKKPNRNIKMVIAYNGAAYHGWQRQADGIDTVQERIEKAAAHVLRHPLALHGAGRTDAGVHASGQVANFYSPNWSIPLNGMRRAINSRLPADIAIRSACEAPEKFHASRSASGKTYRYRIYTAGLRPVELAGQVLHYWRGLDVERMQAAARRLIGTHDFVGLATSADQRDNTVRTIFRCEVARVGPEILISVRGDGFLYNMVRNIVGTLMEIGRGRWDARRIDKILETRDRRNAGPCVLPDGLTLVCVHYRPEDLEIEPTSNPTQG
ncbi:MAG: tRNA pseudouridine(38-40) synthase TruA [Phycisphaerae bacterium]|jgi:tRNA pseudouridine38-40 synthase|nr:tRNA pseudouridine(38-40) synthase TruA [Phycisphaerae bacterium]